MSKNLSIGLNIFLLVLVGILYYLHFSSSPAKANTVAAAKPVSAQPGAMTIAYFELDSIENNYEYLKDVRNELKVKEQQLTTQLNSMKKGYLDKVNRFQQDAQNMSQEKQGAMQQDLMQQQKIIQSKEQSMGNELQDVSFKKMQNVNKRIEDFLKEYNKDKGYTYILAYQPGTIYYKDDKYDITGPVLEGLNASYKSKK